LRARKWNVNDAVTMAEQWCTWWNSPTPCGYGTTPRSLLDEIVDRHEHIYSRLCPLTHTGIDRDGCPIYWEQSGPISQVFSELAAEITLDEMVTRHIRNQEIALCRLHHLSKQFNRPIEKQVIVFNLESLSYSLDTRSLSVFRRIISCDQDFYPERLKHFFVINAPWYFTAIWSVVKPWIDPVTREKMQIIGSDYLPTLLKYIDIDQIPAELGGKYDGIRWSWPYPEDSYATPEHIDEYNLARGRYSESKLRPASAAESSSSGKEQQVDETPGGESESKDQPAEQQEETKDGATETPTA
jgi:hypothetical protein